MKLYLQLVKILQDVDMEKLIDNNNDNDKNDSPPYPSSLDV